MRTADHLLSSQSLSPYSVKVFKMADDDDTMDDKSSEVDVLDKLESELILDYCSYKLWNEFKRGSKLSRGSLQILKGKKIEIKLQFVFRNCECFFSAKFKARCVVYKLRIGFC